MGGHVCAGCAAVDSVRPGWLVGLGSLARVGLADERDADRPGQDRLAGCWRGLAGWLARAPSCALRLPCLRCVCPSRAGRVAAPCVGGSTHSRCASGRAWPRTVTGRWPSLPPAATVLCFLCRARIWAVRRRNSRSERRLSCLFLMIGSLAVTVADRKETPPLQLATCKFANPHKLDQIEQVRWERGRSLLPCCASRSLDDGLS